MHLKLEIITILAYLAFLLGIGALLAKLNRNLSDYVRGGAQGSWWIVGSSVLMSGISAFTFTGNGGQAFSAGPTMLVIYLANCLGFLAGFLFLGAWYRQTRAMTVPDIIRHRFGPEVEQLNAYQGLVIGPISASIQLWALAVFCSSVFGFSIPLIIVGIGSVVLFYSTSGGRWAVMATDFLQSLILIPITLLVAYLCLQEIGGPVEFLRYYSSEDLARDFSLVKEEGQFPGDRFTWKWILGIFLIQFLNQIGVQNGYRYLSVKDGAEARKTALLAMVLMAFGSLVWFIPPMVARFIMAEEVMAMGLKNPEEAAYAVIALKVLPNGLVGVLVVAMLAATMSSMDTGLNNISGSLVRNALPPFRRLLRLGDFSGKAELLTCKVVTVLLGLLIIAYALKFSSQDKIELFDAYLTVYSVIALPLSIPLLIGLFIKKIPRWSYFFIAGWCLVPSVLSYVSGRYWDQPWSIQDRAVWICIAAVVSTLICRPFFRYSSEAYRSRIDGFFEQMRTPVQFSSEIGESRDRMQFKVLANASLLGGACLLLLLLVPNSGEGRIQVAFIPAFVIIVGLLLKWREGKAP
jgi:Na+/proline symporter